MSSIMRFSSRALNFQRKYPDLKWQHCCALAAFYTQQEIEKEASLSPARPGEHETNFFRTFLEKAVRHAGTTEFLSIIQYTMHRAETLDGGHDDGLIG